MAARKRRGGVPVVASMTGFRKPMIVRVHMLGDGEPVEIRRVRAARWLPGGTLLYDEAGLLIATAPGSATLVYTPEPAHGR